MSAILPMLASVDKVEAMTARRLLERIPAEDWESEVFTTENTRVFIEGAIALMTAEPTLERSYQVLARASKIMEGFVNDHDFVDLLRTMELALVRGEVDATRVPGLAIRLGNEFPSGSSVINRELSRLLAYLKAGNLQGRVEEYLLSEDVSMDDKVHVGMYMQSIAEYLTPSSRLAIIDSLETARTAKGVGGSYKQYLQLALNELATTITDDQVKTVLQNGHKWPTAVLTAFYKLPEKIDQETVQLVIEMDEALRQSGADVETDKTRLGVIAILARNGDEASMDYLRKLWREEESRRNDISIGLAQQPEGENWVYLVSSIPLLDDLTGVEVIEKLSAVPRRPRDARHFRDLITAGYRMREPATNATIQLVQHWSGDQIPVDPNQAWDSKMEVCRAWFENKFPEEGTISVDKGTQKVGRYSVDQLLGSIETSTAGNAQRGHALFTKAQCATCHAFNGEGQGVGPDLTSLAQRFSVREVIESTIEPSKVISDRYASKKILTVDGDQFTGMTIEQSDGSFLVLQSDGKRVRVAASDIEEIRDSAVSAMPTGLLDNLSVSEVNDLFAYLMDVRQRTANSTPQQQSVSQAEVAPVR